MCVLVSVIRQWSLNIIKYGPHYQCLTDDKTYLYLSELWDGDLCCKETCLALAHAVLRTLWTHIRKPLLRHWLESRSVASCAPEVSSCFCQQAPDSVASQKISDSFRRKRWDVHNPSVHWRSCLSFWLLFSSKIAFCSAILAAVFSQNVFPYFWGDNLLYLPRSHILQRT